MHNASKYKYTLHKRFHISSLTQENFEVSEWVVYSQLEFKVYASWHLFVQSQKWEHQNKKVCINKFVQS